MTSTTQAQDTRLVTRGFFPVVVGRDVRVERGGGVAFLARHQLTVVRGGGQWLVSGGDLHVEQGGGAALVARSARVERGFIGVLVAGHVELAPGARVLLRPTPALLLAAGIGLLAGWLVGRRSNDEPRAPR